MHVGEGKRQEARRARSVKVGHPAGPRLACGPRAARSRRRHALGDSPSSPRSTSSPRCTSSCTAPRCGACAGRPTENEDAHLDLDGDQAHALLSAAEDWPPHSTMSARCEVAPLRGSRSGWENSRSYPLGSKPRPHTSVLSTLGAARRLHAGERADPPPRGASRGVSRRRGDARARTRTPPTRERWPTSLRSSSDGGEAVRAAGWRPGARALPGLSIFPLDVPICVLNRVAQETYVGLVLARERTPRQRLGKLPS